jgi:oligosaccharyl transferase complex subunit OST4
MITDNQLYSLALFLGGLSMVLIVLYHFIQVNAVDEEGKLINSVAEKEKEKR